MRKPLVGDIGTNEAGFLGFITKVVKIDGETWYEGVHLTGKKFPLGSTWLGRSVRVHGQAEAIVEESWMYRDLCD